MSDLKTSVDPSPPRLSRLIEGATYCRPGDEKRPGLVGMPDFSTYQVCPEDITTPADKEGAVEGVPPAWIVRVVFDKLLDPTVEDLVPTDPTMPAGTQKGTLANTQPVTLKCDGVDVAYDGYYVPNGNRVSWPLGPALFIQPVSATSVATGASCEIGIKDVVHNKNGEPVPTDQRTYKFKIAPMKLRFSAPDPSDGDNGDIVLPPESPVRFYWTAAFTGTPFVDPNEIKIFEAPNVNIGSGNSDGDPDPTVCSGGGTQVAAVDIKTSVEPPRKGASAATIRTTTDLVLDLNVVTSITGLMWKPMTTYRIEFGTGAKLSPKQKGADGTFPVGYKLCFHTIAPAPAM